MWQKVVGGPHAENMILVEAIVNFTLPDSGSTNFGWISVSFYN
jgi:hypothetical protein